MIRIPDAALKAGAQEITLALMHVVDEDAALPLTDDERAELARTVLAAALNAWPGAYTKSEDWYSPADTNLILPLPTEARDE
jgi:hypothetical protein